MNFTLCAQRAGAASVATLCLFATVACSDTTAGDGTPAPESPSVTAVTPIAGSTQVPLNSRVSATFSEPMDPLTLTTTSFALLSGSTPVAGTVTASANGLTATFSADADLAPSTALVARVTTGVKNAAGVALAADFTWNFTTGSTKDQTAPTVTAVSPSADAVSIPINTLISMTFSEAMDPVSISVGAFTLSVGGVAVAGAVTYDDAGTTATFVSTAPLPADTKMTASMAVGAKDLAGNPLAAPYTWSFTTGSVAAKGPAPVGLGTAAQFVVLAKTGVSTVPGSMITGDVGVSPAAATYLTGFSLVADATNVFSLATQVVGKLYAANYAVPTPANLTTAIGNMAAAYTDAAGRPTPDFLELGTGNIGGLTLAPGLYKWTSSVSMPTDVAVEGGANDVWILQTSGDLSMAAGKRVTLKGGAQAKNIFWQVAGHVTIGATAHLVGILLCKTDVTVQTGATMNGRILAQTQVALQQATIVQPAM